MDPKPPAAERTNDAPAGGIPGSRRGRIALVVAIAAVSGIGVGAVVAYGGGAPSAATAPPAVHCPKTTGAPPLVLDLPGAALPSGASTVAIAAAARDRLPAADLRVRVATLMAAYPEAGGAATVAALSRLPRSQPVVATNLGLADLWSCRLKAAVTSLRAAKRLDPYGFYGTAADNALHLGDYRGYPPFLPPVVLPRRSLAQLRAAAAAHPRSVPALIALAGGLQGADRLAAIAAAKRAVTVDPGAITPRVALAVLSFDKDRPQVALGTLQQLANVTPNNAEVSFHLGLVELWVCDTQDAQAQFAQIVRADPHGFYTRFARKFVSGLRLGGRCPPVSG